MKHYLTLLLIPLLIAVTGCGGEDTSLEGKKEKLATLEKSLEELKTEIQDLEKEIAAMDTTNKAATGRLVTTIPVQVMNFKHFIELQGTVESKGEVDISSDIGGIAVSVKVDEGQQVREGQVLIKLDDKLILKQIEELKTAISLAKSVYKRQKNLWDQKIGSELQYLEAENNYKSLQNKLATANEQLAKTQIRSPLSGTVDLVYINEGEMASPGRALVKVVNLKRVKVVADASEKYVGNIASGDSVTVRFPALGIERKAKIAAVGQVINPVNRTFRVEAEIPNSDGTLKANLLAVIKFADYQNDSVIVVPTALVQQADQDDFVFVVGTAEDKQIASKVTIETGKSYNGVTEVLDGLTKEAALIDKGARESTDGEEIRIINNK